MQSTQQKNLPHNAIEEDPYLKAMHENAEKFDPATEAMFRYLQVRLCPASRPHVHVDACRLSLPAAVPWLICSVERAGSTPALVSRDPAGSGAAPLATSPDCIHAGACRSSRPLCSPSPTAPMTWLTPLGRTPPSTASTGTVPLAARPTCLSGSWS